MNIKVNAMAVGLLSTTLLVACADVQAPNDDTATEETVTQSTEKNEAVQLPITIYENGNYNPFAGKEVTFKRTIDSVTLSDFKDEADEIMFFDRYKTTLTNRDVDLINNYKKVTINMSHSLENDGDKKPLEAYVLNKNTQFVSGDNELITNEFLNQQLNAATLKYVMGSDYEPKGNIVLAVPNEFITDSLQLKTIKRQNNKVEVVYIDLQTEK